MSEQEVHRRRRISQPAVVKGLLVLALVMSILGGATLITLLASSSSSPRAVPVVT